MKNELLPYLRYDAFSKKALYAVPKKDLSSIDLKALPIDFSGDITKKLAINNGVGTVAIPENDYPIVFLRATITDVANAAKAQNIEINDIPNNELIIQMDKEGGHFKAVLQNETHHVVHNFYPDDMMLSGSSDDENEDDNDDSSLENLASPLAFLFILFAHYTPSSCELTGKNNGTQTYEGIYNRPTNYQLPKQDKLSIMHSGSFVIRFKLSDQEFEQVKATTLEINNQCQNKALLYHPLPDENQQENCFTSINRLTKTANINTPYMKYFFDYQLTKFGSIPDLHFYHYKHKDEFSFADKVCDMAHNNIDTIYRGAIKLIALGTTFLAAKFLMPGYALAATAGVASYIFNSDTADKVVEGRVHISTDYEIMPCHTNDYFKGQCILDNNKTPFEMCVQEYGSSYPVLQDSEGVFQRIITQYAWLNGASTWSSTVPPQNHSYCIEHHTIKYYEAMPELVGDFYNNTLETVE